MGRRSSLFWGWGLWPLVVAHRNKTGKGDAQDSKLSWPPWPFRRCWPPRRSPLMECPPTNRNQSPTQTQVAPLDLSKSLYKGALALRDTGTPLVGNHNGAYGMTYTKPADIALDLLSTVVAARKGGNLRKLRRNILRTCFGFSRRFKPTRGFSRNSLKFKMAFVPKLNGAGSFTPHWIRGGSTGDECDR